MNGKNGNGNGYNVAKNGSDGKAYAAMSNSDGKADTSSGIRKMEGDFTDSRSGKKSHARSGRIVKSSEGILKTESGFRFDILNKEMDVSMIEGIATGGNPNEGMKIKGGILCYQKLPI